MGACGSITALEQINAKGVFEKHRINEEVTEQIANETLR